MTEDEQRALDRLPCGWLSMDARGNVRAVNAKLGHMLGVEAPSLRGRPFDSLLTRASRLLYQSYLQPLLHLHGQVEEFSLAFDLGGGQTLDALIYCSSAAARPDTEPAAPLTELIVASVRTRRSIEDEMLRIKRAADQAPGMIFQLMQLADGSCHFPYTSEAIRRMYGVTSQQASESAERLLGLVKPETRAELSQSLRNAARSEQDWHAVFEVSATGAAMRWHEAHATPRRLANCVTLWHGHCADVTERRALEAAVADRQAMERMHQARSDFLARVSHELRTPLNGILGFAQLLISDQADNLHTVQRERLDLLASSGHHLLALVNEVLEVTSLEAGQLRVELRELELRPLLELARQAVMASANRSQVVVLPLICPPDLWVLANERRLHQVLANLLSNAIKYNHADGTVQLVAQAHDSEIRLDVVDTGLGMSSEQCDALFQPFNRLGAEKTGIEGHGLGLVISKHLLGLMGATLIVNSEWGRGSVFSMRLQAGRSPTASLSTLPGAIDRLEPQPPGSTPTASSPPHLVSGRVLYVEDDTVNGILMSAVLGMRPQLTLRIATTGAQALEAAREGPLDLLLIDMHLPDTNGIELLAELRKTSGLETTPAIMVSAGARQQDIDRALSSGFRGYWVKPLDIDTTLAQLDEILSGG